MRLFKWLKLGKNYKQPENKDVVFDTLPSLLTIDQVCEIFKVHPNTLRNWDKSGKLPAIRIGVRKDRRYEKETVKKLFNELGSSKQKEPRKTETPKKDKQQKEFIIPELEVSKYVIQPGWSWAKIKLLYISKKFSIFVYSVGVVAFAFLTIQVTFFTYVYVVQAEEGKIKYHNITIEPAEVSGWSMPNNAQQINLLSTDTLSSFTKDNSAYFSNSPIVILGEETEKLAQAEIPSEDIDEPLEEPIIELPEEVIESPVDEIVAPVVEETPTQPVEEPLEEPVEVNIDEINDSPPVENIEPLIDSEPILSETDNIFKAQGFIIPSEIPEEAIISNVNLVISLAADTYPANEDVVIISYSMDAGQTWEIARSISLFEEISNSTNGGFFEYNISGFKELVDFSKFQVKVDYNAVPGSEESIAYLDGLSLDVELQEAEDIVNEIAESIIYEDNDLEVDEVPVFEVEVEEESTFSIFGADSKKREVKDIRIIDPSGEVELANVDIQENKEGRLTKKKFILDESQLDKPGNYRITMLIEQEGVVEEVELDFTWGVLAINPDFAIQKVGQETLFSIGVLDHAGDIVCNADVVLDIVDPNGNVVTRKTSDGTITISEYCQVKGEYNGPDYFATYTSDIPGVYQLNVTATHYNGTNSISDNFQIEDVPRFTIQRDGPTRVFPYLYQPMKLTVTANEDFSGEIRELVTGDYELADYGDAILDQYDNGNEIINSLTWNRNLKAGETVDLTYNFKTPEISPALYFIGPASIGNDWDEGRLWQMAIDATYLYLLGTNSSPGTGWTYIATYNGEFLRAASTALGTGGASTHTHTFSEGVGSASATVDTRNPDFGTGRSSDTHSHTSSGTTIAAANNSPANYTYYLWRYDTLDATPSTVPQNAFAFFKNGSTPSSPWTRFSSADNMLVQFNASHTSGGSDTHTHSVTWGSLGAASGTDQANLRIAGSNPFFPTNTHTHTAPSSPSVTASATSVPQYSTLQLYKQGGTPPSVPTGTVALFDGTPPTGWTVISNASPYQNTYIRSTSSSGSTGGSASNTHSNTVGTSGGPSATLDYNQIPPAGSDFASPTHTHDITLSSYNSPAHDPTYRNFILAECTSCGGGSTITVGGRVYQNNESTSAGTGITVQVYVNGSTQGSDTTDSNGDYSVTGVTASSGDEVTVFLDNHGTYEGTTIYTSDGTNQTDVDVYADAVIIRNETGTSIDNTELESGDRDAGDDDIKFTVNTGSLVVDSAFELHIWTGDTYDPGGTVTTASTTGDLHVEGTMYLDTATNTIAGDIDVDGGTLHVQASTTVQANDVRVISGTMNHTGGTFTIGDSTIEDLIITNGTVTVSGGTMDVKDDIIHDNGTFNVNTGSNIDIGGQYESQGGTTPILNLNGGSMDAANHIRFNSGTVNLAGGTHRAGVGADGIVEITRYGAVTMNMTGGELIGRAVIVYNGGTLTTTTVTGGTLTVDDLYSTVSSAVWYQWSDDSPKFYNLKFNDNPNSFNSSNLDTYLNGDLIVSSGAVLNIGAETATVEGNFTNDGTFNASTSAISMVGSSKEINGTSDTTFNDLTIGDASAGSITVKDVDVTVSGTLDVDTGDSLTIDSIDKVIHTGAAMTLDGTINGAGSIWFTSTSSGPGPTGTGSLTPATTYFDSSGGNILNTTFDARTYAGNVVLYGNNSSNTITAALGTMNFSSNLTLTQDGTGATTIDFNTNDPTVTVTGNVSIDTATTLSASSASNLDINGNYTNNGTFTDNSGTVLLSGTGQQTLSGTMTGSSDFFDLDVTNTFGSVTACNTLTTKGIDFATSATVSGTFTVNDNAHIEYNSGSTYAFTNIDWTGSSGNDIIFRSSTTSVWNLNVTNSSVVSYVDVAYSDATPGVDIDADDGTNTDCNNNIAWTFPVASTTVSGSSNTTGTVKIAVDGSLQTGSGTISGGTWSLTTDSALSGAEVIIAFIDGNGETTESTAITIYDGTGDITGMVLNANVLSVGSVDNPNVDRVDFWTYENSDDEDVMHGHNSSACGFPEICDEEVDIDHGNSYTDETLNILTDATLTMNATNVGGDGDRDVLEVDNISINGSVTTTSQNGTGPRFDIYGNWDNNNDFNSTDETIYLQGTGTHTVDNTGSTDSDVDNVSLNGSRTTTLNSTWTVEDITSGSGTLTVSNALTVTGSITLSAGAINGTSDITVAGNFTGDGTVTMTGSSLVTLDNNTTFGGNTNWSFNDVMLGYNAACSAYYGVTANGTGDITIGGTLEYEDCSCGAECTRNTGMADWGSKDWIFTGSGTGINSPIETSLPTTDYGTSTIRYTGTGTTDVRGSAYNLELLPASGSPTYNLGGGIVLGDLTIDMGTGDINHASNALRMNGSGKSIDVTDVDGVEFYDLYVDGTSNTVSVINNDFEITRAIAVTANNVLSIGSGRTVTHSGTVWATTGTVSGAGTLTFTDTSSGPSTTGTISSIVRYDATGGPIASSTFDARTYAGDVEFYANDTGPGVITAASGTYQFNGDFTTITSVEGTDIKFDTNNPTVNIDGNLTLVDTIFRSTSGNLTLKGDYINTSGSFYDNSGTVILAGTSTQNLSGEMTGVNHDFNNLTVTNTSGVYPEGCAEVYTATVDFTTSVTINGKYTITTAGAVIEYNSGSTYTVGNGIEWTGGSGLGNNIYFRNSNQVSGTWSLDVSGTQTDVSYVDVARSNASAGDTIYANNGTNSDCNNTTNWVFTGTLVSGTSNSTGTVKVAVNSGIQADSDTIAGGTWSVITDANASTNDTITVFIDGATTANESTAVTEYDGAGNITGMVLNQNVLSVGSDDSGVTLTVFQMGQYDNDQDEDIMFTGNSGDLTVDADNVYADDTIDILSGDTLTFGLEGDLFAHNVTINGTLTVGIDSLNTVSGSWDNNSIFNKSVSTTVTFTATTGTETIDSTGATTADFDNLSFTGSGGTTQTASALTVDGDISVNAKTLDINHDTAVNGGAITTVGVGSITNTANTPTVTISGTGNIGGGTGGIDFYNLTTSGTGTTSIVSDVTVTNDATIAQFTTLALNGGNLTTNNNTYAYGTLNIPSDIFTVGNGTTEDLIVNNGGVVNVSGTGTLHTEDDILPVSGGATEDINISGGTVNVDGDFDINSTSDIDITGGTTTVGSSIDMNGGDLAVSSTINVTGVFDLDGGNLHINASADVNLTSTSSDFTVDGASTVVNLNNGSIDAGRHFIWQGGSTVNLYGGSHHAGTQDTGGTVQLAASSDLTLNSISGTNPDASGCNIMGTSILIYGGSVFDTPTVTGGTYCTGTGFGTREIGDWETTAHQLYNLVILEDTSIDNTSTATAIPLAGKLQINSGKTLDANGENITLDGDWVNNGTFTHDNNLVTMTGGDINGINDTTFYDLTIDTGNTTINGLDDPTIANTYTGTNSGDLEINSGRTVTMTGSPNMSFGSVAATVYGAGTLIFTDTAGGPGANGTITVPVRFDATNGDIASSTYDARTYQNVEFYSSSGLARTVTAPSGVFSMEGDMDTTSTTSTLLLDLNTNDPTIVSDGPLTIGTNTTLSASNTSPLYIHNDYTNNGTFTHNSGDVRINGSSVVQELSGSMTGTSKFYDLTVTNTTANGVNFKANTEAQNDMTATSSGSLIMFDGSTTHTYQNIIFDDVSLTDGPVTTGTWNINVAGTRTVTNIDVTDSNACGQAPNIIAVNSTGTNTSCWDFTITVAGTSDSTGTVKVAIDGSVDTGSDTIAGGNWSIQLATAPASGSTITAFIDGAAVGDESTAITVYDGNPRTGGLGVNGMVLNQHVLSVGSADNASITRSDFADYEWQDDEDIMHSTDPAGACPSEDCERDIDIDWNDEYTDDAIHILSNNTLTMAAQHDGGAPPVSQYDHLMVHDVVIDGVITNTSQNNYGPRYSIDGAWDNNNDFNSADEEITFTSSASESLDNTGAIDHDIHETIFNNGSGQWTITTTWLGTDDVTLTNGTVSLTGSAGLTALNLYVNGGTLSGTNDIVVDGDFTGNGTVNMTGGEILLDGSADFGGNTAWTINDLDLPQNPCSGYTTTAIGSGTMTVNGVMTGSYCHDGEDQWHSLNGGSKLWIITGTGTPLVDMVIIPATSTFRYTGSGSNVNVASTSYYNLELTPTSATDFTFYDSVAYNIYNDLDIHASNVNLIANTSSVWMRGASATIDAGGETFYNFTVQDNEGTPALVTLANTDFNVSNTLDIDTSDTLAIPSGRLVTLESTGALTLDGTISGAGQFTYMPTAGFPSSGVISSKVRFDTTDNIISGGAGRTFGGAVEIYSNSSSLRTMAFNAGTLIFQSTFELINENGNSLIVDMSSSNPTTTVDGDVTLGATTTLLAPNSFTLKGDYTNNGTATWGTGDTLYLAGTSTQTLSGTMTTTNGFNNLEITNTSGSAEAACGTASFTPGVEFAAAATIGDTYTINQANSVYVEYLDSALYTFQDVVWTGTSGNEIYFRNSNLVTGQWDLNINGVQTDISYVNVAGSDADTYPRVFAGLTSTDCGDTGRTNDNWSFSPIVSGTSNSTGTVKIAVNSTLQSTSATISGGTWTIDFDSTPSSGDSITVFIDDGAGDTNESTALTVFPAVAQNLSGMVLDTHILSIGSSNTPSLVLSDLSNYDYDDNENVMHTANGSTLDIDGEVVYSDEELNILDNATFSVGAETITARQLETKSVVSDSTLVCTGNCVFNLVNWVHDGIYNAGSGTVDINITGDYSGTGDFNGQTSSFDMDVDGAFTIGGSLNVGTGSTKDIRVGGTWTNNGSFTRGSSTVYKDGSGGSIAGSSSTSFNNLTINYGAGSGTTTVATTCTIEGDLTIAANETLSINSSQDVIWKGPTMSLDSTGTISGAGRFEIRTTGQTFPTTGTVSSVVRFNIATSLTVPARTYGSDLEIFNDIQFATNGANYFPGILTTGTFNIGRDLFIWSDNTGNSVLDAATNDPTINVTRNLDFINNGGTIETGSGTWTIGNDIDLTAGVLTTETGNIIDMDGSYDSSSVLTADGETFEDLNLSGGFFTLTSGHTININNDLDFTGANTITATGSTVEMEGLNSELNGANNNLSNLVINDNTVLTGNLTIISGGLLTVSSGKNFTISSSKTLTYHSTSDIAGTGNIIDIVDGKIIFSVLSGGPGSTITTLSADTRFDTTGGNMASTTFDARTYGGPVEFYQSSATANETITAPNSGTFIFNDAVTMTCSGCTTGSLTLDLDDATDPTLTFNDNLTFDSKSTLLAPSSTDLTIKGNYWNNGGTFTHNNGNVLMNASSGTQQLIGSMTGSNAFYDLTINHSGSGITTAADVTVDNTLDASTPGTSITFSNTDTVIAYNIVFDDLDIANTSAWNLTVNASGTQSVSNTTARYSNACGGADINATDGTNTDGGNNNCWRFIPTITISGRIFTDTGSTPLNCSTPRNVAIRIDGAGTYNANCSNTPSNGSYSISSVDVGSQDVITAFINDDVGADASTVSVATLFSDGGSLTNFDLYYNNLITRHEDAGPITNTDLDQFDDGDDSDVVFAVTTNNIVLDTGVNIFIPSGETYTPGGTITTVGTGDIEVNGTLNSSSNVTVAGGDLSGTGTVNLSGGTLDMQSSGNLGTDTDTDFNNLTISSGAGTTTLTDPATIDGDLTINNGDTLSLSSSLTMDGSSSTFALSGTLTGTGSLIYKSTNVFPNTGTLGAPIILDPVNGHQSLSARSDYQDITISPGITPPSGARNITLLAGTHTINGTLDVQETSATYMTTLTGSANDPTVIIEQDLIASGANGNVTINTGSGDWTVWGDFRVGDSSEAIAAAIFNAEAGNKVILTGQYGAPVSLASTTDDLFNDIDMTGAVSINSTSIVDINGNLNLTSGTITQNLSEIIMSGSSNSIVGGGQSLYNLTIDNGDGTTTLQTSDLTVTGTLEVTSGDTLSIDSGRTLLNTGTNDVAGTGVISGAGTLEFNHLSGGPGTTITTLSSLVQFDASSSSIAATTIDARTYGGGVTLLGAAANSISFASGTYNFQSSLDLSSATNPFSVYFQINDPTVTIGGDLTIDANSFLTASDVNPLTLSGNYTNNGGFIDSLGSVILSGTSKQTLTGNMTGASDFYNVTITNNSGSYPVACGAAIVPSVDFAGSATISGKYTITTSGVTVEYNSGSTYIVGNGIEWTGTSGAGNGVYFRNSNLVSGTWLLDVTGTQTDVSYVDVGRSDASAGDEILANDGTSTDCGNNTNWKFDIDVTISGKVYQSNETSNVGSGVTVQVQVNGVDEDFDTTDTNGDYSVVNVGVFVDDIVTVFLDDHGTYEGTAVVKVTQSNITNMDVIQNAVIVRDESGTTISNSEMEPGDRDAGDDDIKFQIATNDITVDSGFELHVWTGDTYDPNGVITTNATGGDLHVDDNADAIIDTATSTIGRDVIVDSGADLYINASTNINGGDITTSGTSPRVITSGGTPTVTISGTGGIGGGTTPTITFYNLTTSGTGTTTLNSAVTTLGDVSVGSGTTLTGASDLNVNGGDFTGAGTVTFTGGEVELLHNGDLHDSSTKWTFYDLLLTRSGVCIDLNYTTYAKGTGDIEITNSLNSQSCTCGETCGSIHRLSTANGGVSKTWEFSGTGSPISTLTTVNIETEDSTFLYSGTGTVNVYGGTTHNLVLNPSDTDNNYTYNLPNITVWGDVDIDPWVDLDHGINHIHMKGVDKTIDANGSSFYDFLVTGTNNTINVTDTDFNVTRAMQVDSGNVLSIPASRSITYSGVIWAVGGTINGDGLFVITDASSGPSTTGTLDVDVRYDATAGNIASSTLDARTYGGDVEIYSNSGTARTATLPAGTFNITNAGSDPNLYINANSSANMSLDASTNNPTVNIDGDIQFNGTGGGTERFEGTANINVHGGDVTGEGIIDMTGSIFKVTDGGNFGSNQDWTFNTLRFDYTGPSACHTNTTVGTGSGTVTINNEWQFDSCFLGDTYFYNFQGGAKTWEINGQSNTPMTGTHWFRGDTSTVTFRSEGGSVTLPSAGSETVNYFYNLELQPDGDPGVVPEYIFPDTTTTKFYVNNNLILGDNYNNGADTFTVNGTTNNPDIAVGNDLSCNNGLGTSTINTGTGTWTVGGNMNLTNCDVWNATVGNTFEMDGASKSVTSSGKTFYNFDITGGSVSNADAMDVNGTFDVTSGAFTQAAEANLNVAGNFTLANGITFTKASGVGLLILDGDLSFADNTSPLQDLGSVEIGASPDTTTLTTDFSATNLKVKNGDIFYSDGYEVDLSNKFECESNCTFDLTDTGEGDGTIVTVGGDWIVNSSCTFTPSTDSLVEFDGTVNQTVTTGGLAFNDFKVNNSSGTTDNIIISGDLDINGDLTVDDGELEMTTNNPAVYSAGDVTFASGVTVTKGTGTWTFDGTTAKTYTDSTSTPQNIGTVVFNKTSGTPAQDKITLASDMTADTVDIQTGDTLDLANSGYTLSLANAGATATVLTTTGTLTTNTNSTVKYSATNSGGNINIDTTLYDNLQFSGAETYDLTGNLTSSNGLGGNITIDSGATLSTSGSNYNIDLAGNWTNNGEFTDGTSTVTLDGTATQTLSGQMTGATDRFYNLTVTNAGASNPDVDFAAAAEVANNFTADTANSQLEFNAGSTYTFNNISFNGTSGNEVTLRSSSPGTQWNLTSDGTQTVTYTDVQDSYACGGDTIDASGGTNINSQNNDCWIFVGMTVSLTPNSIDLGTLSSALVSQDGVTLTVSTDAANGYQGSVYYDNTLSNGLGDSIADTVGGTIVAGTEEYGASSSRSGYDIGQWSPAACADTASTSNATALTTSPQTFAGASSGVSSHQTTLCILGSITGLTEAGSYVSTITVVVTGLF